MTSALGPRPEHGQPRVLVTGSRHWTDAATVRAALTTAWRRHGRPITVVHGACPTGADHIADTWATEHHLAGITVERWPADWNRHGRAAGPLRNRAMLDSTRHRDGAPITEVHAFPLGNSPGTRGTMAAARARGLVVHDHGPPPPTPDQQPDAIGPSRRPATIGGSFLTRLGFQRPRARR